MTLEKELGLEQAAKRAPSAGRRGSKDDGATVSDEDAIKAVIDNFANLSVSKRPWEEVCTPECIMVRPTGNPLDGKNWEAMMNMEDVKSTYNKVLSIEKLKVAGNMAYAVVVNHSQFSYKGTPNDDIAVLSLVLEKTAAGWKICHGARSSGRKPSEPHPFGVEQLGKPTLHKVYKVPKDKEMEVDALFVAYEKWMSETHSADLKAEGKIHVLDFFTAKGPELSNPMDAASDPTGNIIYVVDETFASAADVQKHQQDTPAWGASDLTQYLVHEDSGTVTNFTALADKKHSTVSAATGDVCIHMFWKVPKADEEAVDKFWKEHEAWMRKSHVMSREGDDSTQPRISSFNIRKGLEKEGSDTLFYIMSETYPSIAGIGKHMELANQDMKEWFASFGEMTPKYAQHMHMGNVRCFGQLQQPGMELKEGSVSFNVALKVPNAEAAAVDEFVGKLEDWARSANSGTGKAEPRALVYFATKVPEATDPNWDVSKGVTDFTLYTIHETYRGTAGADARSKVAPEWVTKGLEDLVSKYGSLHIPNAQVICTMADPMSNCRNTITKSCLGFNMSLSVPEGEESDKVEAFFKQHKAFMDKTHPSRGVGSAPSVLYYTVSKTKDAATGNTLFALVEVYENMEHCGAHFAAGMKEEVMFAEFQRIAGSFAKAAVMFAPVSMAI